MKGAFSYLLLPHLWSSRNRARRRERGDLMRGLLFGGVGLVVFAALFGGAFWLTWQLDDYDELGDYLLRLGLSWLFMTFLAFLTFSGIVTALSTFFLSEDLRLLLAAPVAARRLFYARFARTVVQSSWMVVVFLAPVLMGVGLARCAPISFYLTSVLTVVPFAVIPVAVGTACTLLLVNVFPARRARDLLMLMGLLFAGSIVILLRMIRPEQLMRVESLPDVTGFFATLQSPVTPLLPVVLGGRDAVCKPEGRLGPRPRGRALDDGARVLRGAAGRRRAVAFRRLQPVAGSTQGAFHEVAHVSTSSRALLPLSPVRRQLLVKDLKIFLRDVSQWSQLLLLLALVLIYLYNFRVLDLGRIPYMSGVHQERLRVREPRDGRLRDGDGGRAVRLSGGVGRRRGILDHPHVADLAARFSLVEVLDRPRAGARADRGPDDSGQRAAGRRSVPEGRRSRARSCF